MSKKFVSESHFVIRSSTGLFWSYNEQWSALAADSMIFPTKAALNRYRRRMKMASDVKVSVLTITVRDVTEKKASKV